MAIRADLGVYGTAVGVASGALVSTATYATFKDVFPVLGGPSRFWIALGLAFLFVAVAATGSILLTWRFFSARRQLVVDPGELHHRGHDQQNQSAGGESLTASEEKLIRVRLAGFAQTEQALYARDIETRGHRLCAAARRRGGDEIGAAAAQTESDRLFRTFGEVVYDAQLMVIEMRAAEVYKGWRTVVYAALAARGVASLFLLAAVYEGEREQIVAWNAC